ncbi:lytic transglycosylase domain-containing protein [Mesorhizobium sp. SP-1A]|uniref:lytic transglycosylase domain-containing protein n=1 Tax=Mesorhizobium sp. SP-1A TaxID=3077840 RepID=UPI0028F70230|nr:transglycosylase SLT domain-containing protein [Mesorhizobium sp. SP-1A]
MYKPLVVAAAFAAGVMTFACGTAISAPLSPRLDQGLPQSVNTKQPAKAGTAKVEAVKLEKKAPAKKRKAASRKTKHAAVTPVAKRAASHASAKRTKVRVDMTATASIPAKIDLPQPAASVGKAPYSAIVARYASAYGIPVALANAVIQVESNYQPGKVGSAGEIGLMQIKPATARMLGYTGSAKGLHDPDTNIRYGMKYLAMARDLGDGTTCGTILKYNAGHAAKRMNPISSAYCQKVKVQMAALGAPV